MARFSSSLLTIITIVVRIACKSQVEYYYIVPVNSTDLCLTQYYQSGSCLTLNQLSSQISKTKDIILSFLPGDHLLTWNMTIEHANKVTLFNEQIDSVPRIICSENNWINIMTTNLFNMSGLEVHGCKRTVSLTDYSGIISLYNTSANIEKCIFSNNEIVGIDGGGILCLKSLYNGKILIDSCVFSYNKIMVLALENLIEPNGGAVSIPFSVNNVTLSNTSFIGNSAAGANGGAILVTQTNLSVSNCLFINNSATKGGAIYTRSDNGYEWSLVSSNNVYLNNKADLNGGAIHGSGQLQCTNDLFQSNEAPHGSAVYSRSNTTFTDCNLTGNLGGESVVLIKSTKLNFIGTKVNFVGTNYIVNNLGSFQSHNSLTSFVGTTLLLNNTGKFGGAITCISSTITFEHLSLTQISNNRAIKGGGAYIKESTLIFKGYLNLTENIADTSGGGLYAIQSTIKMAIQYFRQSSESQVIPYSLAYTAYDFHGMVYNISYNRAEKDGGGLYLVGSSVSILSEFITLHCNTARQYGGGAFLTYQSKLILSESYQQLGLVFDNNSAIKGGGIYVEENVNQALCGGGTELKCFFQSKAQEFEFSHLESAWKFLNNTAAETGSDIYGGLLDRCTINPETEQDIKTFSGYNSGLQYFLSITFFDWAQNNTHDFKNKRPYDHEWVKVTNNSDFQHHVSSDPVKVCFCNNDVINSYCNLTHPTVFKKKGERFTLSLVALDQMGNPVNAKIISMLKLENINDGRLKRGQSWRQINKWCTQLEYNVYTSSDSAVVELYADGPCANHGLSKQEVSITFQPCTCPIGFERIPLEIDCSCDCDTRLSNYISKCSTENETVQVNSNVWIEYVNYTNTTDYITHQCPFDYCVQKPVTLSLADQDEQCAFNRTGTLCGECKEGLSLVFATSNCQQCSNYYLFLILPFALAGITLVAFILMLNMTVATGTIHGLIFYANILAASRSIFIPSDSPAFLYVFISWLNLDLGIETCFYSGMNSYGKLLLQLVFPGYVLLLIAIIMIMCDRSQRIAGLLGKKNPEATLYTLLLLSYSKLIRLIITALQFTSISYLDGNQDILWLYDANVVYFTSSHIPRFIAAIIIIILGGVYTILLLFGQLFNRCSGHRLMKWTTHKYYIHFLKAHHAPFSAKHRYWVGLLLLLRLAHYLISAFVSDTTIILSATFIAFSLIFFKQLINGKIYRNYWLDSLETLFLVNLCILGAVTFIIKYIHGSQTALTIVSMSVTLIAFLALVLYHSCGVRLGKVFKRASSSMKHHRHCQLVPNIERVNEEESDDEPLIELGNVENDTDTIVTEPDRYITPPIIRSAVRDDQLREPALDELIPITPEDYNNYY